MAKELILKGMVQGVFCRKYCRDNARRLKLYGSASNLSNGTVRVIIDSDNEEEVNRYVQALKLNPFGYQFFGKIEDIEIFDFTGSRDGEYRF